MIDEARTLEIYGYTSGELKPQSNKPVVAVCEECGKYRDVRRSAYHDLCKTCSVRTPEARMKNSLWHTGIVYSRESCEKRRSNANPLRGNEHPMWIMG